MPQPISEGAVRHALSLDLLRFIHEQRPSEAAATAWAKAQPRNLVNSYHTLRKGGIIQVIDGVMVIAPEYFHGTGRESRVQWENQIYWFYLDRIDTVVRRQ